MENVGEILKHKREELKLSIDEVVAKTKIQKIYIDAIESSNFSFFVGQDFYQQVFVGNYANFLGFDKNEILEKLSLNKSSFAAGTLEVNKKISKNSNSFIEKQVLNRNQQQETVEEVAQVVSPLVEEVLEEEIIIPSKSNEEEIDDLLAQIDGSITVPEEPVVEQELTQPLLDNLIFEQIEKIEQEAKGTPEVKVEVAEVSNDNLSPVIETGVIDIVGGIDIETQSSIDLETQPVLENVEANIELEQAGVQSLDLETNSLADRMASLERDANTVREETVLEQVSQSIPTTNIPTEGKLFINDNNDRTAIDIKVGRALGDIDSFDEKPKKGLKIFEVILGIIIIILVAVIVWLVYNMFN